MNMTIRIVAGIVSFISGFLLLKQVDSFSDLLILLPGVILIVIVPGYCIAPVIAHLFSFLPSSIFFPFGKGDTGSERAAFHKVAEIKNINRPEEALKDYKLIVGRWNTDVKAHCAIVTILYKSGRITEAEEHYRNALNSVSVADKKLLEAVRRELASQNH
jgi:hypothetical protein